MDPGAIGAMIPVVAIVGLFALLIVKTVTRARLENLRAGGGDAAGQEELRAAVEELRREVAELAERVDFTERLLVKQRDADKLAPPPPPPPR